MFLKVGAPPGWRGLCPRHLAPGPAAPGKASGFAELAFLASRQLLGAGSNVLRLERTGWGVGGKEGREGGGGEAEVIRGKGPAGRRDGV